MPEERLPMRKIRDVLRLKAGSARSQIGRAEYRSRQVVWTLSQGLPGSPPFGARGLSDHSTCASTFKVPRRHSTSRLMVRATRCMPTPSLLISLLPIDTVA
jgi:hypothetical protein